MTVPSPKTWFAIDVAAAAEAVGAVENAFDILDALGTETSTLRQKAEDDVTVIAFFDEMPERKEVDAVIADSIEAFGLSSDLVRSTTIREVVEEDWLAEWKRHWRPTPVGRFIIAPPWSEVDESEGIVIRIEPNMAFGTGTHDTTQLCLKAVSEEYSVGQSFLDVGTGTGILAIAAAKLGGGQAEIFACDTDVDSVRIARENALSNGVGNFIEFADGPIDAGIEPYDLVCANLTLDVILPILPLLVRTAKRVLVLSGILAEQEAEIRRALAGLDVAPSEVKYSGEWIAVIISKQIET